MTKAKRVGMLLIGVLLWTGLCQIGVPAAQTGAPRVAGWQRRGVLAGGGPGAG